MVLSLHVIFSPEGEILSRMNFTFPEEGGSIGSDPNSTIVLSGNTYKVLPVHVIILKEKNNYYIKNMSQSGVSVNCSTVLINNNKLLKDGDMIDIGGYRLLVSCFLSRNNKPFLDESDKGVFNINDGRDLKKSGLHNNRTDLDLFDDPFTDFDEPELNRVKTPHPPNNTSIKDSRYSHSHETEYISRDFKSNNVLSSSIAIDDALEPDPFISSSQQGKLEAIHCVDSEVGSAYISQHFPVEQNDICHEPRAVMSMEHYNQVNHSSHNTVVALTEMELMRVKIEGAMQRFLEELSPEYLESMFKDCHIGWRKLKKKDLWELYSSHFFRMMNSNEFQRKFWAYFCDE
ncbi:FHA domain-containing protein [uncultured Shewanella sp.]|uniref:FHA domain-containing protein n=1 Tax=uncultured Shewanella sp. TaxID=173975 RepID=UPI00262B2925|nr:FHA domain-containing protein [uncultured Shewanella sp.]